MIAREDNKGIVVLKRLGTQYIRVMAIRHAPEMLDINSARASR